MSPWFPKRTGMAFCEVSLVVEQRDVSHELFVTSIANPFFPRLSLTQNLQSNTTQRDGPFETFIRETNYRTVHF